MPETQKAPENNVNAVEAAQSVAKAVERVADAAVAEIKKMPSTRRVSDFDFNGTGGGRFRIRGNGFSTNGTLKVGGRQVHANSWGSQEIEGLLPTGLPAAGEVEVRIDDNTVQRATYTSGAVGTFRNL